MPISSRLLMVTVQLQHSVLLQCMVIIDSVFKKSSLPDASEVATIEEGSLELRHLLLHG